MEEETKGTDGSGEHAIASKTAEEPETPVNHSAVSENDSEDAENNDLGEEEQKKSSGNGDCGSNHSGPTDDPEGSSNAEQPTEDPMETAEISENEPSESLDNHIDTKKVNNSGDDRSETDSQEKIDSETAESEKENLAENDSQEDADSVQPKVEENEIEATIDNDSQTNEDNKNDDSQDKNDDSEDKIEDSQDKIDDSQDRIDDSHNKNDDSQGNLNDSQDNVIDSQDNIIDSQENVNDSQDKANDSQVSLTTSDSKDPDDDIENPKFENAPEHLETTQEDHTQALDPFDELLKGPSESPAGKSSALRADVTTINDDDDDEGHDADDDAPAEADVPELPEEEPGADEEVCLLPDTEREISEADKEKALEKRKQAESQSAELNMDIKKIDEAPEVDGEAPAHEESEAAETLDSTAEPETEDAPSAEDPEKEKEHNEAQEEQEDTGQSYIIQEIGPVDQPCVVCSEDKPCTYKYMDAESNLKYICSESCVKSFISTNPKFFVCNKKYVIVEIAPAKMTCSECEEEKTCYFYYNSDGEDTNYCSLECLHSMMSDEQSKYVFKRRVMNIEEQENELDESCFICSAEKCSYKFNRYGETKYVCNMQCIKQLNESEDNRYKLVQKRKKAAKKTNIPILKQPLLKLKVISNATDKYLDERRIQAKTPAAAAAARADREASFVRKCVQCHSVITGDDKNLSWETMDFCNEACLGQYQNMIGAKCANCKNTVNHTSLGKYCVRFGYDIRQFCCSGCLEEFKKGLKICCYCQRDISQGYEGFLAPVGDKGQFKDFCSQQCMGKFEQMSKNPVPQPVWAKCAVCSVEKPTQIEVGIDEDHSQRLCSEPCFAAFKFVNSILPDQCRWCKKYFERRSANAFTIYNELSTHCFCSKSCLNVYISNSRQIVPCNWCKVKKYNFDMIRRSHSSGQSVMMCSLNCLNLYQVSINAVSSRRIKCDQCKRTSQAQYHLTMSDATVRNFCTYQCVMSFQGQYTKHGQPIMVGEQPQEQPKAVPTGAPRRTYANTARNNATQKQQQTRSSLPVISNVQSLATPPPVLTPTKSLTSTRAKSKRLQQQQPPPEPEPPRIKTPPPPPKPPTPPPPPPPKIYNHVLVKTLPPTEVANKATMTKPMMVTKGVSCRPHPCTKECQTDPSLERRVLIPVPVPIYVPVPIAMYSLPFPIPVPIPLPIPTPVFIPTTRNSAKGIMKEITKIHDKMPTDPFEAELLMMAEMVAGDKKKSESDSETDDENDEGFSPDAIDGGNAFGEDMLQMALKMASEYEEPAVDLESAMTASTITPSSHPGMPGLEGEAIHHHHQMMVLEQQRAVAALRATSAQQPATRGKRAPAPAAPVARAQRSSKRRRAEPTPPAPEPVREPVEKPDANMCLKYTFGVNAWKQWVMTKNAEIEKSSIRRKPFKSEILQLTADELNYSLCLFVKEVRKPNGSEYAPDTIYYLVLGIQQYLFENGRIDNIFTDPYYEKFTECLDEVARKFSVLYNDSQYIVTRVEEEHLWESKQLGAHSPHVLLSTLMFFNTKHFNLVTVEEHMQLSFSHIMKHWKRNPNQPGAAKMPGSRNVLLRFYPPQSALEANSRKKKVYEQQENEENPLRCPVKLYEFYISKCPESVRTRNDVFYLMPERSCVPDSPVWYSTQALGRDALAKMLHRVKMVKEINIALLTS